MGKLKSIIIMGIAIIGILVSLFYFDEYDMLYSLVFSGFLFIIVLIYQSSNFIIKTLQVFDVLIAIIVSVILFNIIFLILSGYHMVLTGDWFIFNIALTTNIIYMIIYLLFKRY